MLLIVGKYIFSVTNSPRTRASQRLPINCEEVLELIGENREEIIADVQPVIFNTFDFKHTNINMDWTSFVLYGDKCHNQLFNQTCFYVS